MPLPGLAAALKAGVRKPTRTPGKTGASVQRQLLCPRDEFHGGRNSPIHCALVRTSCSKEILLLVFVFIRSRHKEGNSRASASRARQEQKKSDGAEADGLLARIPLDAVNCTRRFAWHQHMKWIQVGGVSSLALISQLNRGCPHGGASRRRLDFSEVVLMWGRAARAQEWEGKWAGPCWCRFAK